jgi:hypothetical protein
MIRDTPGRVCAERVAIAVVFRKNLPCRMGILGHGAVGRLARKSAHEAK